MAVSRIVLFAILARLLMPADFGLYAACVSILGILEVITLLGVCPALIQRTELNSRHIATAFVLACAFGGAAAAGMWISSDWIARLMKIAPLGEILRAVSPIFFMRSFSMVGYGLAARDMRFSLITFAELASFLVYAIATVILALSGFGCWSLVIGYIIQQALYSLIVMLPYSAQLSWRVHRKELGELLRFCFGINVANIASYVAGQGDNYVVGRFLGVESLGFYSRAYNLMQTFVTSIINTLDRVFFPSLAKLQDDPAGLARTLRLSTALVWMGYLPLSALVSVCAPDIVAVLLGPKWTPMVETFRILTYGLTFRAGYKMAGTILTVQGRTSSMAMTQMVYAILIVLGTAIGSRRGIEGAAVGVLIALGANYLLVNFLGFRSVQQRFSDLRQDLLAAVGLAAALYTSSTVVLQLAIRFEFNPVVRLVCVGLSGLGIYLLFFTCFARALVSKETMDFLNSLWQSLTARWSKVGRKPDMPRPAETYPTKA